MNRNSVKFHNLLALAVLCDAASLFAIETNSFSIDLRNACLLNGAVRVAPSSGNISASPMVDGVRMSEWTTDTPQWDTSTVADGRHTLSVAGESATPKVLTVNNADVVVHEGVLQSDEVWTADKIHVVRDWVRIPEGLRLIIANGTVVKFCQGAGILNNGTLSSASAILTSIEDDSVGGDTNLDGSDSAPASGSYAIRNEGTLNAINNTLRNATSDSVFASTSLAENAFSGCDEITEIVIPSNVVSIGGNAFGDCENLKQVTFQSKWTAVSKNAFDGCDAVETISFAGGLPADEFSMGRSNPTVYVNDSVSETWSSYTVVDLYADEIFEKTMLVPTTEGQVGQVLTVTDEGYDWQDIPVDAELNANSTNAVQNKAVATAVNELKNADASQQNAIVALQTENQSLRSDVDELNRKLETLLELLEGGTGNQKIVTLTLEADWNLVAMPGQAVVSESEKSILDQIEIYTFDKKEKIYVHSDGLKPLDSYWMRAPEKCTIHFIVTDVKNE